MKEIQANEPQPLDCPKCKGKYGYKTTHRIQTYVDMIYDKSGNNDGNVFADGYRVLYTTKRAYCANCDTALPFNVV